MSSNFVPKSFAMMQASMPDWISNRFLIETQGSSDAKSSSIVSFTLPESACLDLASIRLYGDVACTSATVGSKTVHGRLPSDSSSLINDMQVYIGGVCVMSSVGEYNTLAKIKKLAEGSLDRDRTVDRTIHHGQVTSADAAETESFVISEWRGFLGEASSRMLPCDICGPVTIRLTLAQPNVLVPKEASQSIGTALTDSDAESAAAQLTYSVSNLKMSVDSIIPPAAYNMALRERLASNPIKINYKNYFGFSMSGVGSAFTHRFSASSHSIDNLWNVQRNSNYLTTGIVATQLTNNSTAGVGDSIVPNYFTFKTHDNAGASTYQFQVNNTPRPVYRAKLLEALVDFVGYGSDKIGAKAAGSIISDRDWWHNGQGVVGYRMHCPTELGVACKSGFDTSGVQASLQLSMQGLTTPSSGEDRTSYVFVETTQTLCLEAGKQISIVY